MGMEKAHILHPAWFPAVLAQDRAQVGSFNPAWESKMKRAEKMIGRVMENLSMFVLIDS